MEVRGLDTGKYECEILVALQPLGDLGVWNALADVIETAPATWRWWIRRHPAMRPEQDVAFGRLVSLRRPNIVIDPAPPLPALLRHMTVLVSFASGAAVEASWFGVPALFFSSEAAGPFWALIAGRAARVVAVETLVAEITKLPSWPQRPAWKAPPPLIDTLNRLEAMAHGYAVQCAEDGP
jgi:hypothetical protein